MIINNIVDRKTVDKVVDRKVINKVIDRKVANKKLPNLVEILKKKTNTLYVRL